MSQSLKNALSGMEGEVLAWLASSPANARLFASDPLAALRQAVPNVDPQVLDELAALRAARGRVQPHLPNVRLASVRLAGDRGDG